MMPNFFRDMPEREAGRWVAVVLLSHPFGGKWEYRAVEVTGLRRAYVLSRLLALWADLTRPQFYGINYAVRKPTTS